MLRLLKKDKRGVTAVEFSLIAPAFCVMMLLFAELTMLFLTQTALDDASNQLQRLLLTNNNGAGYGTGDGTTAALVSPTVAVESNVCVALINAGLLSSGTTAKDCQCLYNCPCPKSDTSCTPPPKPPNYRFPTDSSIGVRYCVYTTPTSYAALMSPTISTGCTTTTAPPSTMPSSAYMAVRLEVDRQLVTPVLSSAFTNGTMTLFGIAAAQTGL